MPYPVCISLEKKTRSNPPIGTKRRTTQKSMSPKTRIAEFPEEHLTVTSGILFCSACNEEEYRTLPRLRPPLLHATKQLQVGWA